MPVSANLYPSRLVLRLNAGTNPDTGGHPEDRQLQQRQTRHLPGSALRHRSGPGQLKQAAPLLGGKGCSVRAPLCLIVHSAPTLIW